MLLPSAPNQTFFMLASASLAFQTAPPSPLLHFSSLAPKSSLLERRGRGSAPHYVSPRGESSLGATARAWLVMRTENGGGGLSEGGGGDGEGGGGDGDGGLSGGGLGEGGGSDGEGGDGDGGDKGGDSLQAAASSRPR